MWCNNHYRQKHPGLILLVGELSCCSKLASFCIAQCLHLQSWRGSLNDVGGLVRGEEFQHFAGKKLCKRNDWLLHGNSISFQIFETSQTRQKYSQSSWRNFAPFKFKIWWMIPVSYLFGPGVHLCCAGLLSKRQAVTNSIKYSMRIAICNMDTKQQKSTSLKFICVTSKPWLGDLEISALSESPPNFLMYFCRTELTRIQLHFQHYAGGHFPTHKAGWCGTLAQVRYSTELQDQKSINLLELARESFPQI